MLVAFAEPPETSSRGRTLSSSTLVLSTSTSTSTATTSSSNRNSSSACYLPKWTVVSLNDRPNRFSLFRFVSFFFFGTHFFFRFPRCRHRSNHRFRWPKKDIFKKERQREREREKCGVIGMRRHPYTTTATLCVLAQVEGEVAGRLSRAGLFRQQNAGRRRRRRLRVDVGGGRRRNARRKRRRRRRRRRMKEGR